jgi:Fe-S cluster assembly iron-binding protein IscA
MITVTERAATALEAMLTETGAQPGQGVKLVPSARGTVGLTIARPNEGDAVIRRGDIPLLIVDRCITDAFNGAQMDCEEEPFNGQPHARFTLRPQAG